jgi:DNA-binding Lrp family transcriptional regulator
VNSMQAYVLVQTHSGAGRIARDLRAVPGVILAEDLSGPYDAIALARSDSSGRPLEGVIADIREVPGVTRALSAPLIHPSKELRDGEAA